MKVVYNLLNCLLVMIVILAGGCSEGDERRHPLYVQGDRAMRSGDGAAAEEDFKKLLKRRSDCIYTHLRLASVYDELLNNPQKAVMHYQLYLEAFPDAPDAHEVRVWLQQAEKRCYENLKSQFEPESETVAPAANSTADAQSAAPATPTPPDNTAENKEAESPVNNTDSVNAVANDPLPVNSAAAAPAAASTTPDARDAKIAELTDKINQYQARYRLMNAELIKLRKLQQKKTAVVSLPAVQTADKDTNSTGSSAVNRTYTVVPGDSPSLIARKVYGKSSLYPLIMRANPQVDARKLKPGMRLTIPPLPDSN